MPISTRSPMQILQALIAYMAANQTRITDFTIYSPERVFFEGPSMEMSNLWYALKQVELSAFLKTANDTDLDTKAEERGLVRRGAVAASVFGLFSRQAGTASAFSLTIPAGTRVQTDDGILFTTTEDATMLPGVSEVSILCMASSPGLGGNIPIASLNSVLDDFAVEIVVTNPSPGSGGFDEESDYAFRSRAMAKLDIITRGSKGSYEQVCVEGTANAIRALAIGQESRINSVTIVLVTVAGVPTAAELTEAQAYVDDHTGLTDYVVVEPIDFTVFDITVTATKRRGFTDAEVETNILTEVQRFLSHATWPWGGTVAKADLVSVMEGASGVLDIETSTMTPSSSVSVGSKSLPRLGTLTVTVQGA